MWGGLGVFLGFVLGGAQWFEHRRWERDRRRRGGWHA
jgi:hypothetical protein